MKFYTICLISLLLSACNSDQKSLIPQNKADDSENAQGAKAYELEEIGDGILVEKFGSTLVDPGRFTENNKIYTLGARFSYTYAYTNNTGEPFYFELNETGWGFVPQNQLNQNTIREVVISVKPNKPNSAYNQTVIGYTYITGANTIVSSTSGVIENEANVWMHPPRNYLFKILELNPFPYIKQPTEVGNKWTWKLAIGSQWADKRWIEWDGGLTNHYTYQITGVETIDTSFGELDCFVIEAFAESEIGKTQLISYFNDTYGFVKLDYINIDGSAIQMELVEKVIEKAVEQPGKTDDLFPGIIRFDPA